MTDKPTADKSAERGRKPVETKLIRATGELLGLFGPKNLTVRQIAKHAHVNHGQIHHYFGGKRGLLKAAIRQLAQDHMDYNAGLDLDENMVPPPLSLAEDRSYTMAIIRCVVDGDMELATLDIKEGINAPRLIMNKFIRERFHGLSNGEIKSMMAVSIAIEWAWAAFNPYFMEILDAQGSEVEEIRATIAKVSRMFVNDPARLDP